MNHSPEEDKEEQRMSHQGSHADLEKRVAERTKVLAALNAIATTVSQSLDLDQVLNDALDKTLEVMEIKAGGIYLLDEKAGVLTIATHRGFSPEFIKEIEMLQVGEGFSGRVAQSGQPLVIRDISADPLTRIAVREEGPRSLASVPLSSKGKVLGTLFAAPRGYREFTDQDLQLLASIGHQIGMAVENARLFAQSEDRMRELEALYRTEEELNRVEEELYRRLSLDQVLQVLVNVAVELLRADKGSLVVWDAKRERLVVGAARGFSPKTLAQMSFAPGEGIVGRVAASGEPMTVEDTRTDPRVIKRVTESEGMRSSIHVPIKIDGQVFGVLNLNFAQPRAFGGDDLRLCLALAQRAVLAIDNARLYEDTKSRLTQLTALQETTRAVASTLELDTLLNLITQQATTLLQADGGILNLVDWEKKEDEAVACTGLAASGVGGRAALEGGLSGWVTLHNQPIISNQLQNDSRVDRRALAQLEQDIKRRIQNAALAPLTIKGQVMGTLVVMDKQGGTGEFDQTDLDLLVAFANQAAMAIENARLFNAEQRRAEQFRVISEVGRHITSVLAVDDLLEEIVRLLKETFGYYLITIGLIEGDEVVFKAGAKTDWDEPQFRPPPLRVDGKGITAWVAATGEPLLAPDVSQEPRYVFLPDSSETRSELAVPLKTKTGVIGVLNVESDKLNAFDESDLAVLQSLAHQAAIAVENARLYEQAQQAAVLEERERLARELHDSVTQSLYGVTMYAEAAARLLSSENTGLAADYLRELRDTAQEALREMRLLLFQLRPPLLEKEGLVGALETRLEAVEERVGLETEFKVEGEARLPPEMEEGLYRIAQEALNNALRHAQAHRITLYLRQDERIVVVEIADDGIGFDPTTAREQGRLGLSGMEERAKRLGGRLTVTSSPGEGTSVRVEVDR